MLTLDLGEFSFELKDGAIKHVGASTTTATATLYDVESTGVRPFGDKRVKLTFEDGAGNELEVALSPDGATAVADGIADLRDEGTVFE